MDWSSVESVTAYSPRGKFLFTLNQYMGKADLPEAEEKFLRDCFANPDGWDDEVERTLKVLSTGTWTPPEHLANWPGEAAIQ